jgi:hypothetical protein
MILPSLNLPSHCRFCYPLAHKTLLRPRTALRKRSNHLGTVRDAAYSAKFYAGGQSESIPRGRDAVVTGFGQDA